MRRRLTPPSARKEKDALQYRESVNREKRAKGKLTRVDGHPNVGEDLLLRDFDLEEVLGVRSDLGPVKELGPAVEG